jgi:hypothetical protein
MADQRTDEGRREKLDHGSGMLTADELAELRRSARESIAYFREHFRKNPL